MLAFISFCNIRQGKFICIARFYMHFVSKGFTSHHNIITCSSLRPSQQKTPRKNPLQWKKEAQPQGEQQRRLPSPRTFRRAIDVVFLMEAPLRQVIFFLCHILLQVWMLYFKTHTATGHMRR